MTQILKMKVASWRNVFRVVLFASWTYVGIVLAWLLLWLSTGEVLLLTRLTIPFAYWIGLSLVAAAGWALWQRRWRLATLSSAMALLLLGPYVPQYLPRMTAPSSSAQMFTVMTYNAMGLNEEVDAIARVILEQKPDILFLQEFYRMEDLKDRLNALYDGDEVYTAVEQSMGLSTISRFPLTPLPALRGIQKVSVRLGCNELKAWVLRAPKVNGGVEAQYQFFEALANDMATNDRAMLVAGDFNMTERSVPYAYLRRFLNNAHEEAGYGLGATFPAPGRRLGRLLPPMIRIDHIFYNQHLAAHDSIVIGRAGGSDHYPVKALVAFADPGCEDK
jgi:endonuclease/exonuclease/phosphatase (EEP) superfamily protein YafD